MTVRCVFCVGDRATVVLTPSWWGRLFGERERSVDLERTGDLWRTVATRRELSYVTDGSLIRDALDFREVGSPARWTLASGAEAVAP